MRSNNPWIWELSPKRLMKNGTAPWVNWLLTLTLSFPSRFIRHGYVDHSCRQFNNPGFGVVEAADALQRVFWREWPKAVSSRMTPSERRDMSVLLGKALKDPIGWMFYVAGMSKPWWPP
jgi:hypothetical protein